ncbi:autophagy protein Apg9-domain-containing protein [Microdochium bolleyi]|uniref:Autophagy-related protein 9 n=1 Tax=Microdochium bolleyi TaxID=196109 RepID=A0A136J060_9PEZI|nr:autophagy protein Apg9-domain-containing protein [Microdochium bolleyi]
MASNVFRRGGPDDGPPFYRQMGHDDGHDAESGTGLDLDEENLAHNFHDDDLAERLAADSPTSSRSPDAARRRLPPGPGSQQWLLHDDEADNDVPASLLVEEDAAGASKRNPRRTSPKGSNEGAAGPSNRRIQAQWETAQARQRLHPDDNFRQLPTVQPGAAQRRPGMVTNPRDKAMFRWANVSNLDVFIRDVYDYYLGAGMWCILLERALHLIKVLFIAVLLTTLTQCIDYSKIRHSKNLSQIMIPQCTKHMWGIWNFSLWVCSFYLVWKTIQWTLDIPRLMHIRDFYTFLLDIPEEDMQTVSWQDVVAKITGLRDQNVRTATNITPSQRRFLSKQLGPHMAHQGKERLDAHDIANRLMRRENYIIALFNKDVLNLTAPIAFIRRRQWFSRTLEWTVQFGVLDLIFNDSGQVHQRVLRSDHRAQLSREMKTRFAFAAFMNLILTPFLACAMLVDFVFTYYNEFKTNTSSIGARQYTPLARWKFREFNELPHLFEERLNMSYPYAKHYIDQFPKKKTELAARTAQFLVGALIAVLAIVGFSDPEMFVDFEIFPGMTGFGFIALLTTLWAVARGMISEENDVFDPEFAMQSVIEYTHYQPDQWRGRLHSYDVKTEFSELYKPRVIIFVEELLGVLITPLVLYFSLPRCSDQIVDFFREFTVHVDGLGYVCSFAVFDFQKDSRNARAPGHNTADAREDYYATKHGKMQASVHGFLDNYLYNPRSGLPGAQPIGPAGRHQFHPPPQFPGLMSPTFTADLRSSRVGRNELGKSRQPPGPQFPGRTPRVGPAHVAPSPMASMLLDPQHHPAASMIASRNPGHRGGRPYQPSRSFYQQHGADGDIIEESLENTTAGLGPGAGMKTQRSTLHRQNTQYTDDGDVDESVARLGESTWEEDRRGQLSRENSALASDSAEGQEQTGVVQLLRQFQATHLNQRGGVM